MQVDTLMRADGPSTFYSPVARQVLEDFMTTLRTSTGTKEITIDPGIALQFEYDLYGLLTHLNIPNQMHYVIMRVNGMTSPAEYRRTNGELIGMTGLWLPDQTEVNRIIQAQGATTSLA